MLLLTRSIWATSGPAVSTFRGQLDLLFLVPFELESASSFVSAMRLGGWPGGGSLEIECAYLFFDEFVETFVPGEANSRDDFKVLMILAPGTRLCVITTFINPWATSCRMGESVDLPCFV